MDEFEMSRKRSQMFDRNSSLTKKLYYILFNDPINCQKNLLFSPLSLHTVLAMLSEGALETTKDALVRVLEITDSNARDTKIMMESLNSSDDIKLVIANKIYSVFPGKGEIELRERFVETLKDCFKSEFDSVDCSDPKNAAKDINSWVEEKTEGLIGRIFDRIDKPGLLLINVIYFKSDWLYKFDPRPQRKFYLDKSNTIDVDMMYCKRVYNYKIDHELKAQIVEIPYKNKNHNMVVIVPFEKDGIFEVEQKLRAYDMHEIFNEMDMTYIELYLPKFKIVESLELNDPLKEMGLGVIFDSGKANFGAMVQNEDFPVIVTEILQKCVFIVNEEGCEAAAATVVKLRRPVSTKREKPRIPVVDVDHPAIFMLVSSFKRNLLSCFTENCLIPSRSKIYNIVLLKLFLKIITYR